jgi:guanylate kinase
VPDQPVEDSGRPLGAAAGGARRPPSPLTNPDRGARGKLFVVTGPSGAGKGTLIRALVGQRPDLEVAVSATTRPRRAGEEDGREYYFLSDEEFLAREARGDFLEHVEYVSGYLYGTLHSEVDRILSSGRSCVLELETEGAKRVKELLPEAVTIFVTTPSFEELERRLRERATESAGEIEERLARARLQTAEAGAFDHVVVNDDVGRAAVELGEIVDAAARVSAR